MDPLALRPSRLDLVRARVEYQRSLIRAGQARYTPITVSPAGVIIDGHHAVRASAEEGKTVDVLVAPLPVVEKARTVLDLSVR